MRRSAALRRTGRVQATDRRLASGIPDDVRDAVLLRDGHRCRRCGISCLNVPSSIHHRLPRGRGGDARLSNLVRICGSATTPDSCHAWAESQRADAYVDGWLVRTGDDPATIPVIDRHRIARWLTDDGHVVTLTRTTDTPEARRG